LRRERGKMGIVFLQLHLLSSRTVSANVSLPLELNGTPRAAITPRVMELLDWFWISDKAKTYPAQLSGGQRQRVALARALASTPVSCLPTNLSAKEKDGDVQDEFQCSYCQFSVSDAGGSSHERILAATYGVFPPSGRTGACDICSVYTEDHLLWRHSQNDAQTLL
jgi:hypothetical protein